MREAAGEMRGPGRADSRQNTAGVSLTAIYHAGGTCCPSSQKPAQGAGGRSKSHRRTAARAGVRQSQPIARAADLDMTATTHALRELAKLQAFDYRAALSRRAIHMRDASNHSTTWESILRSWSAASARNTKNSIA